VRKPFVLLLVVIGALVIGACEHNMLTGKLTPVPPVHRIALDYEGRAILIAEDPVIETRDPVHVARANEQRVPQDYRASMTSAFALAGFKVVTSPAEPHDLVAKLALAVREEEGKIFQTYRCGLRAPDGAEVAQIDWLWPPGTYVEPHEVFDFATHNLASEVTSSQKVLTYLRSLPVQNKSQRAPRQTDAGPPS
jgi:hypothetical protein